MAGSSHMGEGGGHHHSLHEDLVRHSQRLEKELDLALDTIIRTQQGRSLDDRVALASPRASQIDVLTGFPVFAPRSTSAATPEHDGHRNDLLPGPKRSNRAPLLSDALFSGAGGSGIPASALRGG